MAALDKSTNEASHHRDILRCIVLAAGQKLSLTTALREVTARAFVPALLALACLLAAAPATAQVNYAVSGNTAYVAASPNASGNIVIASNYLGYPVTSIGNFAFFNCIGLTSVTIPNSVNSIENDTFSGCTSLTSVTIGNGVSRIGDWAFYGCISLTSVTLGNSVTRIGNSAFWNCTSLTGVTIPDNVTSLGVAAFFGCTSLADVKIGNSVTLMENSAFEGCTRLTGVTIPKSVTSIWDRAFSGCTHLTHLTFLGNSPEVEGEFDSVGEGATVYYYCGSTGWGSTCGGLPTIMLSTPLNVGAKPGGFGFTLLPCHTNEPIVIHASTNLVNWEPIWTNTPPGAAAEFIDPAWHQHPRRFYRMRPN